MADRNRNPRNQYRKWKYQAIIDGTPDDRSFLKSGEK
jgi:hypothetical protein